MAMQPLRIGCGWPAFNIGSEPDSERGERRGLEKIRRFSMQRKSH